MKLMPYLFLAVAMACIGGSSGLRADEISGAVVDSETQVPLAGASLRVHGTNMSAVTGEDGCFTLQLPADGVVRVEVMYAGYEHLSREITLADGIMHDMVFNLDPEPFVAETIVVTASKNRRRIIDAVETVTVVTADELEQRNATSITNVLREVPGVSMNHGPNPDRERPEIRGMSGERVLLSVDGAKMNLSTMNIGDTHVIADDIARIEVVKGPSSALYGSSAMGGVINIITKEPRALLSDGRSIGARLKYTYEDLNAGSTENLQLYGVAGDALDWKASVTRRDSRYLTLGGSDGQKLKRGEDVSGDNIRLDGIYRMTPHNRLKLQYERFFYNPVTEPGFIARTAGGTYYDYQEREYRRDLYQAVYELIGGGDAVLNMSVRGYRQITDVTDNDEERTDIEGFPPIREILRARDSNKLTTDGGEIKATSLVSIGSGDHVFTYGVEFMRDSYHQVTRGTRSMYNQDDQDGFSGDAARVEPVCEARSPDTEYAVYSAYIQDELYWGDRIIVIPGLRFDSYNANADENTDGYDRTLIESGSSSQTALSPKFGVIGKLSDQQSLTLNIGRGFRVPSKGELYYAFNMADIFYIVPNPALEPETCLNYEISHKIQTRRLHGSTGVFMTRYSDFIGGRYLDPAPGTVLMRYQFINKDRVDMWGVESSYRLSLPGTIGAAAGFTWHQGEYTDTGAKLEGLNKPKITLSMEYSPVIGDIAMRFTAGGRYVGPVDYYTSVEDDAGDDVSLLNEYGGYTIFDAGAGVTFREAYRVNVMVNNVFDKQYREFANLLLPSPGRNVSVSVSAAY